MPTDADHGMIGPLVNDHELVAFELDATRSVGVVRVAVKELAIGRVDVAVLDLNLPLGKGSVEVVAVLSVGCRRGGDAERIELDPVDRHFVAGMSLVVAEPLVVTHVELAGGDFYEARNWAGLGMLAGRGLQPGWGRIGRQGNDRLNVSPLPRPLPPRLAAETRTAFVLPRRALSSAPSSGPSWRLPLPPPFPEISGGGRSATTSLPETSFLMVAAWSTDSPAWVHPSIATRSLRATTAVTFSAAVGRNLTSVPSFSRKPSVSPSGFFVNSATIPLFVGAFWAAPRCLRSLLPGPSRRAGRSLGDLSSPAGCWAMAKYVATASVATEARMIVTRFIKLFLSNSPLSATVF